MNKKEIKNNNKGFTLVETMVAVLILTLTIVSLMTVVSDSLFAARYARNDITAGYLLQEVIDDIRNDRDTSVFLQNTQTIDAAWTAFKTKYNNCTLSAGTGCFYDVVGGYTSPTVCTDTNCRELYYDANANTTPYYMNDNGTNTGKVKAGFQRRIVVTINGNDEMQIAVTVYWKNGGLSKSRTLTNSILKWQS